MLAAGHVHAKRVLDLLTAAELGVKAAGWQFQVGGSLGMEVVLTSPAPPPSDATNYLGGVGDTLEDKVRRGDLAHLGELAGVALYANDRLFHDVRYRWEPATEIGYSVRIWVRDEAATPS
jgi:hypothetical protein